jgi:hypothetical protein
MPTAGEYWEGEFDVNFYGWSQKDKFALIEAIIYGGCIKIEGSADVEVEFEMGDYAPDR